MKKLYISCPMRGRTWENVRRSREMMHKMAEVHWGEDLEVIDTLNNPVPYAMQDERIYQLGQSISKMADADYYIGVFADCSPFHGCRVENEVAKLYEVPTCIIPMRMMPDLGEAEMKAL